MQKTAIILGATGLTGRFVLEQLLSDERYSAIKLFSRSSVGLNHPMIEEFLGDVLTLEQFKGDFTGDEVYCCIGTTKKKTPNKELYRAIDFGIPAKGAHLAKENGIEAFAVVSALGASSKSTIGYNRIKGDMENAVLEAGLERTFILRPSLIVGDRKEHRSGERFAAGLFRFLKPLFFGPFRKYRAVEAKDIASKMIALLNSDSPSKIVESEAIVIP